MVKKEMGEDAVILKTRTIHGPGKGGKGSGSRIEVTAAVDYEAPGSGATRAKDPSEFHAFIKKWDTLEAELRDIKEALLSAEAGTTLMPDLYYDKTLSSRYINFKTFGLRPEVIRELMRECHTRGDGKGLDSASKLLKDSLSKVLTRMSISRDGERAEGARAEGARVFSFIGPTGVGKTTTLAKLAAVKAVKQGRKAALVTLDTFRIAAVDQLRTYARIMGIPLEVAGSRKDLQQAIAKHAACDIILIDTAGRSPNNGQEVLELKDLFDIREAVHHYLVLSSTTGYGGLCHADEKFGTLPFKSYIFTKLDEVQDASSMVNFLISRHKPVSYFTTGQQVPEDIEVASKKRLASLLLARMQTLAEKPTDEVRTYGSSCWT
ncbi:MAG: flagellar biosynthesis protein FlhF [Pseudomonadota bacterium]